MTKHYKTLRGLCAPFDTVAFDVWGVLWDGGRFYDGVVDGMKSLRDAGKKIAILTNTTQLGHEAEEEYTKRGLEKSTHYDVLLTAGDVSRKRILSRAFNAVAADAGRYAVIGRDNPQMFDGSGMAMTENLARADFVYIGVPEKNGVRQLSADAFVPDLKKCLDRGLPLFCPNPDYYAPSGGVFQACQGLIAKTYEDMGGRVEWGGGKPFREIFDTAMDRLGVADRASVCMIGDTIRTDIAGAKNAGIKSVLVTETGVAAAAMAGGKTLRSLCAEEGARPDFTLSRVGRKAVPGG